MAQVISLFLFLFIFLWPHTAPLAATPLELSAQKTLEWHRDDHKITAAGNVKITQGDISLSCDQVSATYRDGAKQNKFLPQLLTAQKNVIITSPDGTAYGDQVVYNVPDQKAVMTGESLRMISGDMILYAAGKFEYQTQKGELSASENVRLVQTTKETTNTLTADHMTAFFGKESDDAGKKRILQRLEASGNVVITTPTETISGQQGVYHKAQNTAELSGNVRIVRGENTLEGDHATVDLNTNISTLSGGTGRVKGVFFPE